jgi:hypothetical protein
MKRSMSSSTKSFEAVLEERLKGSLDLKDILLAEIKKNRVKQMIKDMLEMEKEKQ